MNLITGRSHGDESKVYLGLEIGEILNQFNLAFIPLYTLFEDQLIRVYVFLINFYISIKSA